MRYLDRQEFGKLIDALVAAGYDPIGPTVRDGAVVLDHIEGVEDLPRGVGVQQGPGTYRLADRGDDLLFSWAHGPRAGKSFLFPGREVLCSAKRSEGRLDVECAPVDERPLAFVGLRSCDLHAIGIQDKVFLDTDPSYAKRREQALFISVNCGVPNGTCFCASMGTGPRCTVGFDLALTELPAGFVVEVASPHGEQVLEAVKSREATDEEMFAAEAVTSGAEGNMGRSLDTSDMPDLLYRNRQNPRWKDVAARCLACGNCTSACPTCFCHDIVEGVSVDGRSATRARQWANCFSEEFTHIVGMEIRASRESRYRQWLTHKFAAWIDQFGTSGCVGCGRCITWCPVGIDVTEEVAAIRATDGKVEVMAS